MIRRVAFVMFVLAVALLVTTSAVAAQTTTTVDADETFDIGDGESYTFTLDLPDGAIEIESATFDIDVCDDQGQSIDLRLEVDGVELGTDTANTPTTGCVTRTVTFDDQVVDVDGDDATVEFIFEPAAGSPTISSEPTDTQEFSVRQLDPTFSNPTETATDEPPTDLSVDVDDLDGQDELDVVFERHDGDVIATDTVTQPGTASVSWDWTAEDTDENGQLSWTARAGIATESSTFDADSSAPTLTNAEPDNEEINTSPVELSVDVDDADFDTVQGDRIELTWTHDGDVVDTTTLTEATTATTSVEPNPDENDWQVTAKDAYGNEETVSANFTTPSEISIRPVDDPDGLVDEVEVTVQIFGTDEVFERTTTDGTVSMSDLPPDERLVITAEADGYHIRQVIIESIIEQQNVYLLEDSSEVDVVEPLFEVSDPTGQFQAQSSQLIIERPLTIDGETTWRVVAADEFGVDGYSPILQRDQRYRLTIRNDDGNVRTLGSFTATDSERVELTIEGVDFDFTLDDVEGIEWTARLDAEAHLLTFAYLDNDEQTDLLTARAYERGNESNLLFEETWAPANDIQFEADVEDNTTTWVVEFEAERGDEVIEERRLVGPGQILVGTQVDDRWLTVAGAGMLLVVGGLFGAARPEVGAVSVSALGAVLWMIGWLPGTTTGAMVLLSMFISALYYVKAQQTGVA